MMLITPFALFPPRHGGARRVAELLRALRDDFDIVLISDEARLYDARSFAYFDGLYAVQLRPARSGLEKGGRRRWSIECARTAIRASSPRSRSDASLYRPSSSRSSTSSWPISCAARRWASRGFSACTMRTARPISPTNNEAAAFVTNVLSAYDAVTVCSDEDRLLVRHPRTVSVPNGSPPPRYALPSFGLDAAAVHRTVPLRTQPRGHPPIPGAKRIPQSKARFPQSGCWYWAVTMRPPSPPAIPRSRSRASKSPAIGTTCRRRSRGARCRSTRCEHSRLGDQADRIADGRTRMRQHHRRRARFSRGGLRRPRHRARRRPRWSTRSSRC